MAAADSAEDEDGIGGSYGGDGSEASERTVGVTVALFVEKVLHGFPILAFSRVLDDFRVCARRSHACVVVLCIVWECISRGVSWYT